jgi:hypothetical protein
MHSEIKCLDCFANDAMCARSRSRWQAGGDEEHHRTSIVRTFARMGGIASSDQVLGLMPDRGEQPLSRLARHLVDRTAISFSWQSATWLPLFQFDRPGMSIRPSVTLVLSHLVDVFDDWELAAWFAQPNSWLGAMSPLEAIASIPGRVHEAARIDQFIARG